MAPWEPGYVPPIRQEATKRILIYLTTEQHSRFLAAVKAEQQTKGVGKKALSMQSVLLDAIARYTAAVEKRSVAQKRSAPAKPRKR